MTALQEVDKQPTPITSTSPGSGCWRRQGTPRPILTKISQDIAKAINIADVRARMEQQGALPVTNMPEQFDAIIRNDTERNSRILKEAGVAGD